jgi:hypothetical protein
VVDRVVEADVGEVRVVVVEADVGEVCVVVVEVLVVVLGAVAGSWGTDGDQPADARPSSVGATSWRVWSGESTLTQDAIGISVNVKVMGRKRVGRIAR